MFNELLEDIGKNGPDFVQGVDSWIHIQGGSHSREICDRYDGVAPPEGHGTHVHGIKACTPDTMLDLRDGFHLNQIYHGMERHILGKAVLRGKYTNQAVRSQTGRRGRYRKKKYRYLVRKYA